MRIVDIYFINLERNVTMKRINLRKTLSATVMIGGIIMSANALADPQ